VLTLDLCPIEDPEAASPVMKCLDARVRGVMLRADAWLTAPTAAAKHGGHFVSALYRLFEILVGVLALLGGCLSSVWFVASGRALIERQSDFPFGAVLLALVVTGLVAGSCFTTAWRLFTRREQRRGGLLSPAVLILFGVGCVVGAVAAIWYRGADGHYASTVLMSNAVGCFGLALSRMGRPTERG